MTKPDDLREEMARALLAKLHPTAQWDEISNAWKDAYLSQADALLHIIDRVRAEERERCAKVADTVPIETYASPPYIAQAKQVRLTVAAAIRALK